ncbi:MAG: aminotransferase class I/II-fold pyridoxal phosphate-dependent enzyme [Verrucomicrobiota bacterium]
MTSGKIQFVDLAAQYEQLKPEIDASMARVYACGDFILGEDVQSFEREFAAFCRAPHRLAVANGTEALQLALLACGVGPGDEVITCTQTFIATVQAIHQAGAKPVLVDCVPHFYSIDPAQAERAITPRTKSPIAKPQYSPLWHCWRVQLGGLMIERVNGQTHAAHGEFLAYPGPGLD